MSMGSNVRQSTADSPAIGVVRCFCLDVSHPEVSALGRKVAIPPTEVSDLLGNAIASTGRFSAMWT
jgi:hypothetical protein